MFSMHSQLVNHMQYNFYPPVPMTDERMAMLMEAVEEVAAYGGEQAFDPQDAALTRVCNLVEAFHLDFFVEWYEQVQTLCHQCERDMDVWDMLPHYLDRGLCMSCINKQEGV